MKQFNIHKHNLFLLINCFCCQIMFTDRLRKRQAPRPPRNTIGAYTREQKLVAAVWYHERLYTGMTIDQLAINFEIRFKAKSPDSNLLSKWDRKLFKDGRFKEPGQKVPRTTIHRWVYIPYIKESFIKFPGLLNKARANMLGLSDSSLKRILKIDISEEEIELWKKQGREKAALLRRCSTSLDDVEGSCSKKNNTDKEIDPVADNETIKVEIADEDLHEEIFIKSEDIEN